MNHSGLKLTWIHLDNVDSTNLYLKNSIHNAELSQAAVWAQRQTRGRGRLERRWESPHGGLYLSISRPHTRSDLPPVMVTVAAGVALATLVREIYGVSARLRWPNDLMVGGCKLCGMLSELVHSPKGVPHVVVGIGLNVNADVRPEDRPDSTTCLAGETGTRFDIEAVRDAVADAVVGTWERLYQHGRDPMIKRWEELSETVGSEVEITTRDRVVRGYCLGVTPVFQLIVRSGGEELTISEGDCRRLVPAVS